MNIYFLIFKYGIIQVMNTPKPPKRNRYPFDKMKNGAYEKLMFHSIDDAKKARLAVHSLGSRTGKKFITHLDCNKKSSLVALEVWRSI